MTTTQPEQTAPEQGRFDYFALTADLGIFPDDDPLPRVYGGGTDGNIPMIRFENHHGSALTIHLQTASPHAQAQWLYALAASLNSLAREVEAPR